MTPGNTVPPPGDIPISQQTNAPGYRPAQKSLAYTLCGCAALIEGFDLLVGGVTAPLFAAEFGMTPDRVGMVFLLTSFGLALGAAYGGWLGDRLGIRSALTAAVALFGLSSIAGAIAFDATMFTITRGLAGIGLGATLPNIITLLSNVGSPEGAARRVMLSVTAIGIGSIAVGALMAFGPPGLSWRAFLHIGGWIPLALSVIIFLCLPHIDAPPQSSGTDHAHASINRIQLLFDAKHRTATIFLWTAFLVTAGTSYLLTSWMPTFLVEAGIGQQKLGVAMMTWSIGGLMGPAALSALLRPGRLRHVVCIGYLGSVLGIVSLINADGTIFAICGAIGLTAFFVAGTQATLYGMVGSFYPPSAQGTGVGAAVAIGRIGSGVIPMLAGLMLAASVPKTFILIAVVPLLLIALGGLLVLLRDRSPKLRKQRPTCLLNSR